MVIFASLSNHCLSYFKIPTSLLHIFFFFLASHLGNCHFVWMTVDKTSDHLIALSKLVPIYSKIIGLPNNCIKLVVIWRRLWLSTKWVKTPNQQILHMYILSKIKCIKLRQNSSSSTDAATSPPSDLWSWAYIVICNLTILDEMETNLWVQVFLTECDTTRLGLSEVRLPFIIAVLPTPRNCRIFTKTLKFDFF